MRKGFEKVLAGDQAEHAVAEEFEAFVVNPARGLAMRTMGERAFEPVGTLEAVPERRFQQRALLVGHVREPRSLFRLRGLLGLIRVLLAPVLQTSHDLATAIESVHGLREVARALEAVPEDVVIRLDPGWQPLRRLLQLLGRVLEILPRK